MLNSWGTHIKTNKRNNVVPLRNTATKTEINLARKPNVTRGSVYSYTKMAVFPPTHKYSRFWNIFLFFSLNPSSNSHFQLQMQLECFGHDCLLKSFTSISLTILHCLVSQLDSFVLSSNVRYHILYQRGLITAFNEHFFFPCQSHIMVWQRLSAALHLADSDQLTF